MYVNVYDNNMEQIGVIDVFTSLIWTKRYNDVGDFEIVMPLDDYIPTYIKPDNYVSLNEDLELGYYMIIETIYIDQDSENGLTLTISGRSLEILLDRRIVWDAVTYLSKETEEIIKDLISKSIINPNIEDRKISGFVYKDPDEKVKSSKISVEFDGESLLDSAITLCSENNNSISVRYINDKFVYQTYSGTDRSHDQTDVDEVLYSPTMDSLGSSRYLESIKNYKNVLQISNGTKTFTVGSSKGIERRERREISQNVTSQANANSIANLLLYQNRKTSALEGEAINDVYIFGRDIFVGDIVQFANGYGIETKARITEYIYSQDMTGINNYPTFAIIN